MTYPVGLITVDETAYAGGVFGSSNNSFYLYTGSYFWALSPYLFNGSDAYEFTLTSSGGWQGSDVGTSYGGSSYGVRPVLALKAGTEISSGSGTATDPFIVN